MGECKLHATYAAAIMVTPTAAADGSEATACAYVYSLPFC